MTAGTDTPVTVSQAMARMIDFSQGNLRDIHHLIAVWTYAKTIGELEGLDSETRYILELAAITHDIACPLCREKYGNTDGKLQEREGPALAESFFQDAGLSDHQLERVKHLIGHHHTLTGIDGLDYQILIEADYIVNAAEQGYSRENIQDFLERFAKTDAGKRLIKSTFRLG